MELKKLFMFGAVAATVLSACGEKDVFDPNYEVEKAKGDYATNFVKKFGAVNPSQKWDLSTGDWTYVMNTRGDEEVVITIGEGKEQSMSSAFRKSISTAFPEGDCQIANLAKNGQGYTLISHGPFDIYPIYHGRSNKWTLMVNGQKITDFEGINKMMGWPKKSTDKITDPTDTNALTVKGWRIDAPVGTELYIQLLCEETNKGYMKKGDIVSSVNFNIGTDDGSKYDPKKGVTISHKHGSSWSSTSYTHENLTQGSLAILPESELWSKFSDNPFSEILLFEDAFHSSTDLDYNDFFLGIVGRDTPPVPIEIEKWEVKKDFQLAKRYMIEDLGSTDDFDFNDIVVDLTGHLYEHYTQYFDPATGKSWSEPVEDPRYGGLDVHVIHKGGIYPFQLTIGGKVLDKMGGNIDANGYEREAKAPDFYEKWIEIKDATTFDEADKVLKSNDIKVKVFKGDTTTESSEQSWDIVFPGPGDIPMIIATDKTVKFMDERVRIPLETWISNANK